MSISFRTNSDGSNGAVQLNGTDRIVMTSSGNVTFKNSGTTTFEGTVEWPASPAFTGTPTAPTAAVGTNTTQIATTAFVQSAKPSGGIRGQVFTSSGTFTVPAGVTALKVRGCGGGGGNSSSNGGTTSFGAYCSATGGGAGSPASAVKIPAAGFGGAATGGNLNITGGAGAAVASGASCSGGAVGGARGGASTSASTALPEAQGLLGVYGCGGGGTSSSGGAGGYFEKYITGLTPGASIMVTIGAAGTGAGAGICIVEW